MRVPHNSFSGHSQATQSIQEKWVKYLVDIRG